MQSDIEGDGVAVKKFFQDLMRIAKLADYENSGREARAHSEGFADGYEQGYSHAKSETENADKQPSHYAGSYTK